jgi:hypothetical protein
MIDYIAKRYGIDFKEAGNYSELFYWRIKLQDAIEYINTKPEQ